MTSASGPVPHGSGPCLFYKAIIFRKDARKVKG